MKNKTKIYIITGSLIVVTFALLFLINVITGQKNNKKPVKPIALTTDVTLAEVPTTVLNTNRSISISKTVKENSSSSTKSSSSKANSSSSNSSTSNSSSENSSSSQVSSSSASNDSELELRLQWKEDCKLLSNFADNGQKPQITNLGDGKQIIITTCNNGAYQGQSLVYYYELSPSGKWLSQRQTFWNNANYLNLPTLNSNTLTDFDKFRGVGDCGRMSKYDFNSNTKTFEPIKIQEQDCVPIEQNPSAIKDFNGEVISIDRNLWPIIYERR
jgi:Protein of unknown function (DUF1176)